MAAIQCHKPVEESTVIRRKTTTTETSYNKPNNEHSLANKMKEMANSATKLFHHPQNAANHTTHTATNSLNKHEGGGGQYHQVQQSGTCISSNTPHATNMHMQEKKKKESMTCTGKKKKQHENVTFNGTGRKEEKHGAGGGFLANMEEQVKHFTHKVEGKGKGKSKGHDSSSDSSSDDECRSKKK